MTLVYDASALLDLTPERARRSAAMRLKRGLVPIRGAVAPSLILWELGNALRGTGAGRASETPEAATLLEDLLTQVRLVFPDYQTRNRSRVLAQQERLSFYDASYLATAESIANAVLITEDKKLLKAARRVLGRDRAHTAESASRAFDLES